MKKQYWILSITIVILLSIICYLLLQKPPKVIVEPVKKAAEPENQVPADVGLEGMSNPASDYCVSKGGNLEIVTESDGGQFGLCRFKDYTCEEWVYFRNECDIEADALKIRRALINKGLKLTNMKVVINKHLGRDIGAGVVPVNADVGGGYVFAVKTEDGIIKILADGNGSIMCSSFKDYPDFSAYLVPECTDDLTGKPVTR